MKRPSLLLAVSMVMLVMMMNEVPSVAQVQTCSPNELLPCGQPPSAQCCDVLKQLKLWKDCLCTLIKDPESKKFIADLENVIAECGVPHPMC